MYLRVHPWLLLLSISLIIPNVGRAFELFARTNLVAWCIVPFDAKKRGPEERAQMLDQLGIKRFAYDWRAEHVPTFDEEIAACRRHGIEITAWWFPTTLDKDAEAILAAIERNKLRTQLWVTGGAVDPAASQRQRIEREVNRLGPIAYAAARLGCTVGLYNHGGWSGEPTNQVAIVGELRRMGLTNAGIVYNFHHGHEHLDRFAESFRAMQPHLLVVNINGMTRDGDKRGQKILAVGAGDRELEMLKVIRGSGWRGPVGILDHRNETDSEETLKENLKGLETLAKQL